MTIEQVIQNQEFEGLRADDWNQLAYVADTVREESNYASGKLLVPQMYCAAFIPVNAAVSLATPQPFPATDLDSFRLSRRVTVEAPSADLAKLGNLLITQSHQEINQSGDAMPDGMVRIRVDVTDVEHQYAYPKGGVFHELQSGGMGYRICWKETQATGVQWCIVRMSHFGFTTVGGLTSGTIAAGGSGTITVDNGTVPDGRTYTVWDYFGEAIGSGVRVAAWHLRPDKAYVLAAACETSGGGGGPVNP